MTGLALDDTIGRTADILARMETSILEEDRGMIETLTFDLHSVLSGVAVAVPGSEEERIITEKIFERTVRLEKLLADRMTAKALPSVRRKLKHKPGRVSYSQ